MPDRDRGPALSSLGTRPPADLPWDARPAATAALPPPVPPAPRVVRAPTAVLAPSAWPPSPAGPCGAGGGGPCRGSGAAPGLSSDAVLNACYRGCRLFSICHFVDASAALNTTRAECEAACAEAYSNAQERFGCRTGCRKQLPEVESRMDKVKAPPFSVLDLVSTFCNDIVSSAQSFISSTWTFYLQADDGKVVVFQVGGEPGSLGGEGRIQHPCTQTCSGCPGSASPFSLPGPRQKEEKHPPGKEPRGKAKPADAPQPEHDFLGCMAKRSGLPRWILAACLFLSIMVMLWLSCASLVTAPEQHVKTQDLDGPGAFPLPPVIAVTLCPAHGEDAGPLPLKVDLDKTVL
uniref:Transmembrane protein 59 like n=1 Tax=Anser brachyrhynchus TaxID=132585 RepID=A0A8B9BKK2_9AVES